MSSGLGGLRKGLALSRANPGVLPVFAVWRVELERLVPVVRVLCVGPLVVSLRLYLAIPKSKSTGTGLPR